MIGHNLNVLIYVTDKNMFYKKYSKGVRKTKQTMEKKKKKDR